jgi:uncharacterized protein YqgC (DUF456 family)
MTATVRNVCGIALLVAGILGCLLPIIPGIPLLAAGVAVLGGNHPIVRSGRGWLIRKGLWKEAAKPDDAATERKGDGPGRQA